MAQFMASESPTRDVSFDLFPWWKKTWYLGPAPSCSQSSVPAWALGGFLELISDIV